MCRGKDFVFYWNFKNICLENIRKFLENFFVELKLEIMKELF